MTNQFFLILKIKMIILLRTIKIYVCFTYIIPYIYDSFNSSVTIEAASNSPTTGNSSKSNGGGDAIIMTAALASGAKLAQKAPNLATKAAFIAGSIGVGATAIIVKNVSGYVSSDVEKSSLLSLASLAITNISLKDSTVASPEEAQATPLIELLYKIFDLSGNSVQDLLKMIDYINNLQYLFLYFIIYLYILLSIDSSKMEFYLNKIYPKIFVQYFMISVNLVKKSGRIYIILFFLLLSSSIYLSNHYFSFLYENFDAICEFYQSKK